MIVTIIVALVGYWVIYQWLKLAIDVTGAISSDPNSKERSKK